MTEGLESWVRALAAAGLFTGAVLTLSPGGRSGKVLRLVCSLLLLAVLLSPLGRLDYSAYAEELSRQRLLGLDLSAKGEAESLRLLGSIIRKQKAVCHVDRRLNRSGSSIGIVSDMDSSCCKAEFIVILTHVNSFFLSEI